MNKIELNLKGKSGVYLFFNTVSGKRYVGSSIDIYNRIHEHIHNLKNNKAHNIHFQASWNKHGEDAFIYCVLEFCKPEIRFEREQYYIDCLKPEYNLTLNVIANFGHSPTIETREKISSTLKKRYESGELQTYKQKHLWKTIYIYDVHSFKLVNICKNKAEALKFVGQDNSTRYSENRVYYNKYCLTTKEFNNDLEIINYIYKNLYITTSKKGKYIITENTEGELQYHLNLVSCAEKSNSSRSTLMKHSNATKENPYIIKTNNYKFYYSNEYIPITNCRSFEKLNELLQTNIGEGCDVNPEISIEIKESIPS